MDVIRLVHTLRAAIHSYRGVCCRRASSTTAPSHQKGPCSYWCQQRTGRRVQPFGNLLFPDMVPDRDVIISLDGGFAFASEQLLYINRLSFRWVSVACLL